MTQHRVTTRRSRWPTNWMAWVHWKSGRGERPSSRMPVTDRAAQPGAMPQTYRDVRAGDLISLESWAIGRPEDPCLVHQRCLVCEKAIGHATCRIISLTVIPDGMPTTWGLPTRAYLAHTACATTDPVALHWAAHLRECPGCSCPRTYLAADQEVHIPIPAPMAGA